MYLFVCSILLKKKKQHKKNLCIKQRLLRMARGLIFLSAENKQKTAYGKEFSIFRKQNNKFYSILTISKVILGSEFPKKNVKQKMSKK